MMNPVFTYLINFKKTDNTYRLIGYNSPYKNSEQELEDISLIFDGRDLQGHNLPILKVINWKELKDGEYVAEVVCYFIPNKENDGTYNQLFQLREIKPKNAN